MEADLDDELSFTDFCISVSDDFLSLVSIFFLLEFIPLSRFSFALGARDDTSNLVLVCGWAGSRFSLIEASLFFIESISSLSLGV